MILTVDMITLVKIEHKSIHCMSWHCFDTVACRVDEGNPPPVDEFMRRNVDESIAAIRLEKDTMSRRLRLKSSD